MNDCIFCKIIKGELPTVKVYEDDLILAIKDIKPQTPVHILLISKKHIQNLAEVKDRDLLGYIQLKAIEIAKENNISDNFKLVTNCGPKAGQEIMHLHYHLLGGFK